MASHQLKIELGASLAHGFESSLNRGTAKLGALGKAIQTLDVRSRRALALVTLRKQTDQAKKAWKDAEARVKALAQQMKTSAEPSQRLVQQFKEATQAAKEAKGAFQEKQQALEDLDASLRKAGVDTAKLTEHEAKLGAVFERVHRSSQAAHASLAVAHKQWGKAKTQLRSLAKVATTIVTSLILPTKKAMELQTSLVNLGKVVRLTRAGGLELLRSELEGLTKHLPYRLKELSDLAVEGARLGIPDSQLKDWTAAVAKMAHVFGISLEEAAKHVQRLSGAFDLKPKQIEPLGDLIDFLGDTSRISTATLVKGMGDLAAIGRQFGFTPEALGRTVTSLVKMGYEAKQVKPILEQLLPKIHELGAGTHRELSLAAKRIGILPKTLRKALKRNPEEALLAVLEKIKAVPLEDQAEVLERIFGSGLQAHVSKIANQVHFFKETLAGVGEMTGSLNRDFNTVMKRFKEQASLLGNAFERLGTALGEKLLPPLTKATAFLTEKLHALMDFFEQHAEIAQPLQKGILALGSFIGGVKLLKVLERGASAAFYAFKGSLIMVGASLLKIGALIMAHPVMAGIGALIAGAALVIKYWTPIKEFFARLFDGLVEKLQIIKEFFIGIGSKLSQLGSKVGGFFKGLWPFGGNKEGSQGIITERQTAPEKLFSSPSSTHRVLNNNTTINIYGNQQDTEDLVERIRRILRETTEGALYDTQLYAGRGS